MYCFYQLVELDVKNERKRVSRMWQSTYLSIKPQKLPGSASGPRRFFTEVMNSLVAPYS